MTIRRLQKMFALALCISLVAPGCAAARSSRPGVPAGSAPAAGRGQAIDPATLTEYLKTFPPGTTLWVERADGRSFRATLLKLTDRSLIVQEKTRIPEPAIEIPFTEVLRVTAAKNGNGNSVARAIGIGAAAAGAAVLTIVLVLAASYSD